MKKAKKRMTHRTLKKKTASKPKKAAVRAAAKEKKLKGMSKTQAKKYRELLVKMRQRVGGDLTHITDNTLNKSARDASGDLSGYSYHMADQATDDYDRDFSLGRATEEQKSLYSIDEAMKRIDEGVYGLCLQCSKAIPRKRLAVLPQSELCIDCQKKNETK